MDYRLIGSTLPRTFFRLEARPGRRVLHGDGHDSGQLALDVNAGELYFVSLNVIGTASRISCWFPPKPGSWMSCAAAP